MTPRPISFRNPNPCQPRLTSELLLPAVELVLVVVLLQRPEVRQNADKVAEVHDLGLHAAGTAGHSVPVLRIAAPDAAAAGLGVAEEGVDDAVAEGVDSQLGDAEEVLAGEVALLLLVQGGEAAPQSLDLVRSDWKRSKKKYSVKPVLLVLGTV